MGVGVEWGIVGGDIYVVGGVCGATEWEILVGPEPLPVLPRGGGAAVDAGGGVVERATIHERDLSQHLRWDALSRGRGADGE